MTIWVKLAFAFAGLLVASIPWTILARNVHWSNKAIFYVFAPLFLVFPVFYCLTISSKKGTPIGIKKHLTIVLMALCLTLIWCVTAFDVNWALLGIFLGISL